jgi:hypothetical protein
MRVLLAGLVFAFLPAAVVLPASSGACRTQIKIVSFPCHGWVIGRRPRNSRHSEAGGPEGAAVPLTLRRVFDLDALRPPEDVVPAVVPLGVDVGTNDLVAMAITHLKAYSTGFEFDFTALTKEPPGVVCADELAVARDAGEDPVGLQFHLGVKFADGRREDTLKPWISSNRAAASNRIHLPSDPLMEISVRPLGASANDRRYTGSIWVWPLPPEGPLTFWVGWPSAGLPSRPTVIDASLVLDAVSAATKLWSDG